MDKQDNLTLTGSAHWSARGDIKSTTWYWWMEVKGVTISDTEMRDHAIKLEYGVAFITEIEPLLPDSFSIDEPYGVPGGTWDISIPLNKFKDPEAALRIIEKYFPGLYALA